MIRFISLHLRILRNVFPKPDSKYIRLGRLAAAEEIPVCLEASRLVVRHSAIVGSTGSGKTSAVASLLQNFVRGGWRAANIVVIDPHGEYARAVGDNASVRSVLGESGQRLRVPYWALPATDIVRIFTGAPGGATFASRFTEAVTRARREFVEAAKWLALDPTAVTSDTPVPFDIRPIWLQLDSENRETRMNKADPASACRTDSRRCGSAAFSPVHTIRSGWPAAAPRSLLRYLRNDSGSASPRLARSTTPLFPRAGRRSRGK